MANFRKMGASRPTRVIFIIAALIIAFIVVMFVGMNVSHNSEMDDVQRNQTQSETEGPPGEAP